MRSCFGAKGPPADQELAPDPASSSRLGTCAQTLSTIARPVIAARRPRVLSWARDWGARHRKNPALRIAFSARRAVVCAPFQFAGLHLLFSESLASPPKPPRWNPPSRSRYLTPRSPLHLGRESIRPRSGVSLYIACSIGLPAVKTTCGQATR